MRRSLLLLAAALLVIGSTSRAADDSKKPTKSVEELYPQFDAKGEFWYHYSNPRTLEFFGFSKYTTKDLKAAPKYHVGLKFYQADDAPKPVHPGYYGAAEKVEATADNGLKITLPATKDAPKRELLLTRTGEKVELRIPDGPGKGAYTLELRPKLPDRKTVLAKFQETWGSENTKQPIQFLRFYPYFADDDTGRPGIRHYVFFVPSKEDDSDAKGFSGPAEAVEELKDGGLKVTLPPAKPDGAKREFLLKRDGDNLIVRVADGPLKGDSRLRKHQSFDPKLVFANYRGPWMVADQEKPLMVFQFGSYEPGNGPPIVRFHLGLVFKNDDPDAREGFYGQPYSVREDRKAGVLKVTLPPVKKGGPERELVLKLVGDNLELTVPEGKFKGTYKLVPMKK